MFLRRLVPSGACLHSRQLLSQKRELITLTSVTIRTVQRAVMTMCDFTTCHNNILSNSTAQCQPSTSTFNKVDNTFYSSNASSIWRIRRKIEWTIFNELGHRRSRDRKRGWDVQIWRYRVENLSFAQKPRRLSLAFNLIYLGDFIRWIFLGYGPWRTPSQNPKVRLVVYCETTVG